MTPAPVHPWEEAGIRPFSIGLHRGSAQLTRGSLTSMLKLAAVGALVLAGTRTATGLLSA